MTLHSTRPDARTDLLPRHPRHADPADLQWGPQHGYAIAQTIRAQSSDVLQVETGSLYPALQRLAKKGWVTAKWGQTEANQRAKFYQHHPRRQAAARPRRIAVDRTGARRSAAS